LPTLSTSCVIAALAVLAALPASRARTVLTALAGLACGAAWAGWLASAALADALPADLEGRDVQLTGSVTGLPATGNAVRFQFAVESARTPRGAVRVPRLVALGWYPVRGAKVPALASGQRWRFTARLVRPHGNANPFGFDYEVWLLEQGVRATGTVRSDAVLLDGRARTAGALVHRARAALRDRIAAALPGARYAAVVTALVIGDQRGIAPQDWSVFTRTGVGHLISISGLHVTMLAAAAAACVRLLWRAPALALALPAQKAAALAGLCTAALYVLLAGWGVPAQRTLYMLAAVAFALWSGRRASVSHVLCLALLAVLLPDPWAVLWPGFWLSFGTVALIVYACGELAAVQGWRGAVREACRVQAAVTLGLAPLGVLLFGQVSLVSPLANALAIPVISLLAAPLALAGACAPDPLGVWLLHGAHGAIAALAWALEWLAGPPWAVWRAPAPGIAAFALAAAGTLWLLAPRGWPVRWCGAALVLPLLGARPAAPAAGNLRATVFDVGQGGAVLLETAHHRLLYDTGPVYAPGADAGGRVLLPYFAGRGIAALDALVVSHADADHSGGAATLLSAVRPDWSLSSLTAPPLPRHRPCRAGQRWTWDGVRFEIVHPAAADYATAASTNALSCVLKVSTARYALLLTGDIEAAQEAALVGRADLRADVLLAPHHGSRTSSTAPFLRAVQPRIVIFQVGHRNRYRHPQAAVWRAYAAAGAARWRTDEAGALAVEFGDTITLDGFRAAHARYWYGR
jgi:competence protein ComEC